MVDKHDLRGSIEKMREVAQLLNDFLPFCFNPTFLWILQTLLAKFLLEGISKDCRECWPTTKNIVVYTSDRTVDVIVLIIDEDSLTSIEFLLIAFCHARTGKYPCSFQWMIAIEKEEQNDRQ